MQAIALSVIVLASAWLGLVAGLMISRPRRCLHWLGLFASTWQINLTELGLRAATGAALIVRAPESKAAPPFEAAGWFLIVTAALLAAIPRRWHAAYAVWWSRRIAPWVVQASAVPAAAVAIATVWLAV